MLLRLFIVLSLLLGLPVYADDISSQVLAEMNLARTQPQAYARIVEGFASRYGSGDGAKSVREAVSFLNRVRPLPPLAWSQGISQAALGHAQDVGSRGGRGHSGSGGSTPWKRMARYGQWSGYAGENIDYGHRDARSIVVALIVDHGVRDRGHRANVFSRNFRVAGVAIAPHAVWGTMCVTNFASGFTESGEPRLTDRVGFGLRSEYMGRSFF